MKFGPDGRATGGLDLECWKEVDGTAVVFVARGQAACPVDADQSIFRDVSNALAIFNQRSHPGFQFRTVAPEGANDFKGGGGNWAGYRVGYGVFTERGLISPKAGLLGVGEDGQVFTCPDAQAPRGYVIGEDVYDAQGNLKPGVTHHRSELPISARDFKAYKHGECSWSNEDGSAEHSHYGMALTIQGEAIGAPVWRVINGLPWITYHNGFVLRSRPCTSTIGVAIDSTWPEHYFSHDALEVAPGMLKVGWCVESGERALQYTHKTIDLATAPRVDFAQLTPPTPKPDVFDMRVWGFFGTREAFPRNDGGSVYDYQPYRLQDGRGGYAVVKFSNPAARTFFEEHDGAIWLRQDFTAPESTLKHGYALTNGRWFPRQWDLTPFRVEDNETLVFDASGHVAERHHFWYERRAKYVDAFDFGGDVGVQPCLKVFRDSSPFTQNPRDWECSYLTEAFGDTAWEDGHNPGVLVIWNRLGGQRVQPLPPLPIPQHHPEVPLAKRMKVSLQTLTGQYVVAEGGGGSEVNANREHRGPWEEFILTVLEDNVPDPTPPQPGPDPNPQ